MTDRGFLQQLRDWQLELPQVGERHGLSTGE
jgi:hypothetical protein